MNTYNIYEKEISNMDFNNDKFTLTNLYNICQKGFSKADNIVKITIELHNKILKINFKILSDLMSFDHSFELQEKYDDNIHMKELKKEIDALKQKNSNLEIQINKNHNATHEIINGNYTEVWKGINKNDGNINKLIKNIVYNKTLKESSILPIIDPYNLLDTSNNPLNLFDEKSIEEKYKVFLTWLNTSICSALANGHISTINSIKYITPYYSILYILVEIPSDIDGINMNTLLRSDGNSMYIACCHNQQNGRHYDINNPLINKDIYRYLKVRYIDVVIKENVGKMYWQFVL
jgi:hypothetical protein